MRKALLNNALLAVLLIATACSTPQAVFESKRDPDYSGKMDRLLIISLNEELTDTQLMRHFSKSTINDITIALKKHGVDVQVTSPNPKEIDPDAVVLQSIVRDQPNQLLYFGATDVRNEYWVDRNFSHRIVHSEVERVVFGAKLVDARTHKTVWRSTMRFWFEPEPADVARQLVDKLAAEKLVPDLH